MSRHPHDELRDLERRADPAWLWDADRNRLVWANRAGLAFWGEATVLDLIDRRLDDRDAAVIGMENLVAALEPGVDSVQTLVFEFDRRTEALQTNCRRVILEDGRPGLLVVRGPEAVAGPAPQETRASLLEAVVEHLPAPVVIFDRHGSLLYQNDAARDGFAATGAPVSDSDTGADGEADTGADTGKGLFATWLGNNSRAETLMARALSRGSFSEAEVLQTRFGPRTHRINARRLAAPVVGRLAVFMVFEDIEDRRRHELRQAETLAALQAIVDAADATFEIDAQGRVVDFGGGAEGVFGDGIGVLIGAKWDDVLAAVEFKSAVPFSRRQSQPQPWRELLRSSVAGAPVLGISAVPVRTADGKFAGYRGLVLALDGTQLGPLDHHGHQDPAKAQITPASGQATGEDAPATDDEARFLADLQRDRLADDAAGPPDVDVNDPAPVAPVTPATPETPVTESAGRRQGKVGRDDAATFSAIARALDSARKPASPPAADPQAASGATLRVVGGVDALGAGTAEPQPTDAPAPDLPAKGEPAEALLATGKPTLVHRHFVILGANVPAARLLGHDTVQSLMQDTNLLNLMPDERARLFSLQSRFDDHDLPQFGRIDGIVLKARRKNRATLDVLASFDEVQLDGKPAIRIILEPKTADAGGPAEPVAKPDPVSRDVSQASRGPAPELQADAAPQVDPTAVPSEAQSDSAALSAAVARETELRAVINTAADGIATIDGKGLVITLNASAEAIFGVEAPSVAGRKFTELFTPQGAETISGYLSSITSDQPARLHREGHEVAGKRPDGGQVPLFVTIGRMNIEEGLQYCAVIRDISQWKETEEGLRLAKERAEEESAKKSDFLARISHELRTPLNAIIGFSEVMSEEKFGPIANDRYKGYLNDIRSSGDHLLSLINDLLDLSKIEAGKLDLNFTSVDVARLIEQGVAIIQPQANQARVIVRVSLPDHLPPVVADERSLRQIILNLLSNAVKFTPAGGQVILSAVVDEQGRLQVRVRDTGVGMSRDQIDRAMEPFRQIETQGQADHTGTGLGLPLTKALTEANRAEFLIESTPSAGTLVHITFPTSRVLDG